MSFFWKGKYLEYHKIYIALAVAGSFLVSSPLLTEFSITTSGIKVKLKDNLLQLIKKDLNVRTLLAESTKDKKLAAELNAQIKNITVILERYPEIKDQRTVAKVLDEINAATPPLGTISTRILLNLGPAAGAPLTVPGIASDVGTVRK